MYYCNSISFSFEPAPNKYIRLDLRILMCRQVHLIFCLPLFWLDFSFYSIQLNTLITVISQVLYLLLLQHYWHENTSYTNTCPLPRATCMSLSLPKCAPKGRVPELRRSLARRHRISARHRDEAQPSASQVLLRLTALLDLIENLVNLRRKLKFVLGTRN